MDFLKKFDHVESLKSLGKCLDENPLKEGDLKLEKEDLKIIRKQRVNCSDFLKRAKGSFSVMDY